jgi:hypothetical protein
MSIGQQSLSADYSLRYLYMQASSNLLHIISNTMQITTATTSETMEVATSTVNETNISDVDQQQNQSKKQVFIYKIKI